MVKDLEEAVDRTIEELIDKRRFKIKDKDLIETVEEVFDQFTLTSLYELMRRLRLKKLTGVISAGKEARIYRAIDYKGTEYAVKIYLTFTSEFKKSIWKYIYGDPRFEDAKISSTRRLMCLWARKEYKNLDRMYRCGVRVPKPIGYRDNILVMEFIGENGVRAPLLKEYVFEDLSEAEDFFNKIVVNIVKMYCKAKLVHADLSEYNIMVFNNEPVIIDVSQAVLLDHPNAEIFFKKDINNIYRYFTEEVGLELDFTLEELIERVRKCREA